MRFFLRLVRASASETYSEEEERWLREVLASAPGLEQVRQVSRDPKGGYAITMDVDRDKIDALLKYLTAQDLRDVI